MGLSKWIRNLTKPSAATEAKMRGRRSQSPFNEDEAQLTSEGKIERPASLDREGSSFPGIVSSFNTTCDCCRKIVASKKDVISHYNYTLLTDSAEKGCRVCRFFQENCSRTGDSRAAEIYINPTEGELYYRQPTSSGGSRTTFQVFSPNGKLSKASVPWREIDQDPLAKSSLAILRSWLTVCFETHLGCTQAVESLPPTRLIEISRSGSLKLCELDAPNMNHIKYTALSHCWGERQVFHTTAANLRAYMSIISMDELPRAFQDAVILTRKLGLDYLWIDSICIVQDSDEDWANECLRMGDYYRNAYITISALEAPDSHTSFLQPRKLPKAVQLPSTPGLYMRPKRLERRQIFREAVLNSRGWSFQERLLSTRVLHFTHYEMFWECCTCSAEETSMAYYHQNAVDFRSLGPSDGEDFKRALFSLDPEHFSESNGAFLLWQRLVRQFSRRSLTYISDRLPAVSGLAALIAVKTGSQYLAGIWEHDLSGLAWFRDSRTYLVDHSKSRSRIGDFLAPSWSWASMRTSVVYRFDDGGIIRSSKDPVFIESNLDVSSINPFGNVASGYIVISALAISVYITDDLVSTSDGNHMVGTAYMDKPFHEPEEGLEILAVRVSERGLISRHKPDVTPDETVVHFLLITADSHENKNWYRIGAGVSRKTFSDHAQHDDFSHPFKEEDRNILRLL